MLRHGLWLLLSVFGLLVVIALHWIPKKGVRTLSNAGLGSPLGLLLLLGWFSSFAFGLELLQPDHVFKVGLLLIVWLYLAFWGWELYAPFIRLDYQPFIQRGYIPVLVNYWVASVTQAEIMQVGKTYVLTLGLTKRRCDARLTFPLRVNPETPEGLAYIKEFFSQARSLKLRQFQEEALVASGALFANKLLRITFQAPALSLAQAEYQVELESLLTAPLKISLTPQQLGTHSLAIDFLDYQQHRCGGLVVPVKVRAQEPHLGAQSARLLQTSGILLSLMSAGILIFEIIAPLLLPN